MNYIKQKLLYFGCKTVWNISSFKWPLFLEVTLIFMSAILKDSQCCIEVWYLQSSHKKSVSWIFFPSKRASKFARCKIVLTENSLCFFCCVIFSLFRFFVTILNFREIIVSDWPQDQIIFVKPKINKVFEYLTKCNLDGEQNLPDLMMPLGGKIIDQN